MTDSSRPTIGVFGASGFVGSAVMTALARRGARPVPLKAPRVQAPEVVPTNDLTTVFRSAYDQVCGAVTRCDVVVNCAGDPDAGSRDLATLYGANGVLPGLIAAAARSTSADRFVHVSSAVVQGRAARLDDSLAVDGFSAYARSKILGERTALDLGPDQTCVYRPPSVHAASRKVSRLTTRIAASPLASVAAPGTQNSPQAHIDNVGDIIAFLALVRDAPPPVVIHPSEGWTSAELMELLGDRTPTLLPRSLARTAVLVAEHAGRVIPAVAANARRVEMLWFGQEQAPSWATDNGWVPVATRHDWSELARQLRPTANATPRGHH